MVLDSKLQRIREHYGISEVEEWQQVKPEWILQMDGIGEATLNFIRVQLAARGLCLLNDNTPEFWRKNLGHMVFGQTMGDIEWGSDRYPATPFTILVDTAEQEPFTFLGIRSSITGLPWIPKIEQRPLGRHPYQFGDYSVEGGVGRCCIERKSVNDFIGTVLGWGGGRERFEQELKNLSDVKRGGAIVVVEGSIHSVLAAVKQRGKKTVEENRRIIMTSIVAFTQDYGVPILLFDNRRLAEIFTFRHIQRFWKQNLRKRKQEESIAKSI